MSSRTVLLTTGASVAVVTLFLALRGGAKPAVARAVFPVAKVEVGKVLAGDTAELRFPVRNEGSRPLRFVSVEGDCGCVTADLPPELPAGASGEIRARFNPAPVWSGKMEKGVRVRTSDASVGEVRLTLTADVEPLIRLEPPSPLIIQFEHDRPYQRRVIIRPRGGASVRIDAPKTDSPVVKPSLSRLKPGEYALDLDIAPRTGPGDYNAVVSIPTGEPKIPSLPVTVVGFARTGPVVTPTSLMPPEIAGRAGAEVARMQVFTRSGKLKILGVDTGEGLKAEIIPRTPDQFYEVALTLTGQPRPGSLKRLIRIRTDHPRFAALTVPLDARLR